MTGSKQYAVSSLSEYFEEGSAHTTGNAGAKRLNDRDSCACLLQDSLLWEMEKSLP